MRGKNDWWADMSGNMGEYAQNFHFHSWVKFLNIKKGSYFLKKIGICVLSKHTKQNQSR